MKMKNEELFVKLRERGRVGKGRSIIDYLLL